MDTDISSQLEKILALVDSSHDAEALAAMRKARQMLSREGISFAELARAARKPGMNRTFSIFSSAPAQLEPQLVQLRQRLDDMQTEAQAQNVQIEFWRKRSAEFEQNFYAARSEAERWRKLARETVEKLWDLGYEAPAESDVSHQKTA